MKNSVALKCPAKVNLALSVGAPLANGFHPIASWMCRVSLYDDLTLAPLEAGAASTFDIDWAEDAPQASAIDWPLAKDLGVRAHGLMEQHVGQALPIAYTLRKRIPVGAGMAGGSTNAAGTLMGLNELFGLGLSMETLAGLTVTLGSDIPFFFGAGSAIVTGLGEVIEPAPIERAIHLAMIFPPLHCNTGAVYRAFDGLVAEGAVEGVVDEAGVRELASADLTANGPFNDLAAPACRVESRLADLRERIFKGTGCPVHITGSGAAMFIVAGDAAEAERLAQEAGGVGGVATMALRTV
ncbi:MAG: 4-(cytidine 5'-diphospho)-2-C-methyl-D-erythritol kinase [Planctomycetota bacterium]|jgi:4-diphosphocytidyl-2C-methyl-D-erythritol kinase